MIFYHLWRFYAIEVCKLLNLSLYNKWEKEFCMFSLLFSLLANLKKLSIRNYFLLRDAIVIRVSSLCYRIKKGV